MFEIINLICYFLIKSFDIKDIKNYILNLFIITEVAE